MSEEIRNNTLDAMNTVVAALLNVPRREIPAELRIHICKFRGWRTEDDRRREDEDKKAEQKKRKAKYDADFQGRVREAAVKLGDDKMSLELEAQEDIVHGGDSAVLPFKLY